MFVVTNGKNYLGTNSSRKVVAVKELEEALSFSEKQKAENYLLNLPKEFRNVGYKCEEIVEEIVPVPGEIIKIEEITNLIPQMEKVLGKMAGQKAIVENAIHQMDAATLDLMHYAEFNTLNVVNGYKFYKQLREIRLKRREYKDVLRMIDLLTHSTGLSIAGGAFSKELEAMKNRAYAPRFLDELFE